MKKRLLYSSAALLILWMVGFFLMGLSAAVVHTMLWLSAILFLRSFFVCNTGTVSLAKQDKL